MRSVPMRPIVLTALLFALATGLGMAGCGSAPSTPSPAAARHPGRRAAAPKRRRATHARAARGTALAALTALPVKGRAPKTGYSREQFGAGWLTVNGCDTRDRILRRDLTRSSTVMDGTCEVRSGRLDDPYTAAPIAFVRGDGADVDIDHVVALGDAWQKGAQQWSPARRIAFANDPLNLLAVDA